jgi:2-keto-4-pentenoate hydratase
MTDEAITRAAALLRGAMLQRKPLPALPPDCRPATLEEAYAVQARFVARLGTPVGYKVGYTNPAIQRRFGLREPVSGRLIAGRVLESPARIDPGALLMRAAEPEFAYRLRERLPRSEAPFARERVSRAFEAVIPALEIVETRFEDWERIGPLQTVADNALGSHWVGGEPVRDWRPEEIRAQEIVARVNGVEVTRGRGSHVLGDPVNALVWLANDLATRGTELAAGEVVTTGCCTAVVEASPGDTVSADFGRFGRVSVTFSP